MPEPLPDPDSILQEYDREHYLKYLFTAEVHRLINEFLDASGIRVLSVTHRVKSRESLREKLIRPSRKYNDLRDVTDICGVRIITYLADDVDRVAEIVQKEFDVDAARSVDKRQALDPDQLGLHVAAL